MDVYIKAGKETFHFPVNPFTVKVNGSKAFETFNLMSKGEVDFTSKKAKNVKTLSMTTEFNKNYSSYNRYKNIPKPYNAIKKIEKYCNSFEPIRLIITDYRFNELVHLVNFSDDQSGDYQGDKNISLDFRIVDTDVNKLVKEVKPKAKANKKKKPKLKSRTPVKNNKLHVVKKGDTLWAIAKKNYGNGSAYTKIVNANKDTIKNPNVIIPGQKLIIP